MRIVMRAHARTLPARQVVLWAWVLIALVLSQSLGFIHGSLHGESAYAAPSKGASHVTDTSGRAPATLAGHDLAALLAALYSHHASGSDCRLYDQMSHGDCAPTAAVVFVPLRIAAASELPMATGRSVTTRAWVQARGPPRIS